MIFKLFWLSLYESNFQINGKFFHGYTSKNNILQLCFFYIINRNISPLKSNLFSENFTFPIFIMLIFFPAQEK